MTIAIKAVRRVRPQLQLTVRKLLKRKGAIELAASEGYPLRWLTLFAAGAISAPGVDRVEALYVLLTGRPLPL